jgi:hypothetical protein
MLTVSVGGRESRKIDNSRQVRRERQALRAAAFCRS